MTKAGITLARTAVGDRYLPRTDVAEGYNWRRAVRPFHFWINTTEDGDFGIAKSVVADETHGETVV